MKSRKLVRLGKSSLVVSLPKYWIEELGLKAGDEVLFKKEYDGSLKIIPKEKILSPHLSELEINAEECRNEKLLNFILRSGYLTGKEKIVISSSEGLKGWQLDGIREIMEEIRGLEIEEQNINKVVLRTFVDSTKINALSYFKRKVSLITSMLEYLLNGVLEKRADLLDEIQFLFKELSRVYLGATRQLLITQMKGESLENIGFDNPLQILEARVIIYNLLSMGHEINNLSKYAMKHIEEIAIKNTLVIGVIKSIVNELKNTLTSWLDALSKKNIDKLIELLDKLITTEEYDELVDNICRNEDLEANRMFIRKMFTTFLFGFTLIKGIIEASMNMFIINPPKTCLIVKPPTT